MKYTRVLPRDLFNESKLLKCLGRFYLFYHDNIFPDGINVNITQVEDDKFEVQQRESDGMLYTTSLVYIVNIIPIFLGTVYNSKDPYPLIWEDKDEDGYVFKDDGSLSSDFINYFLFK